VAWADEQFEYPVIVEPAFSVPGSFAATTAE
jgi:hypothetical protein